jgi:Flp pilus assembly protein TadG
MIFARRISRRGTETARFRAFVRQLGKDDSGVYAVEFALLAVPFFAILFASLQYSYFYFTTQIIQQMTQKATRALLIGSAQTKTITTSVNGNQTTLSVQTPAQFKQYLLCPVSSVNPTYVPVPALFSSAIDCSKLFVDVRSATSWSPSTVNVFDPAQVKYCPGNAGIITIVTVGYELLVVLPISFPNPTTGLIQNGNQYYQKVVSSEAIKTEGFSATDLGPSC